MTKKRANEIKAELKAKYPKIKFSITTEKWRSITIKVMSAPEAYGFQFVNRQINEQWLEECLADKALEIMQDIKAIANEGVRYYDTADYGTQPSFYVWLGVGKWDKPFMTNEQLADKKNLACK